MTTNFFIPFASFDSFRKLVSKVSKHININVEYGEFYNKTFNHPIINEDGNRGGCTKMSHKVCDVSITIPDFNNWELIATYKEGVLFVADFSKELVFSNKEHGANYHTCDCCGHKIRKTMFVIRNKETDEELQVGSECAKTYGIEGLRWVEKFYSELYAIYDFSIKDSYEDGYSTWRGGNDSAAFMSVKVDDVIKSSKQYFDDFNGIWEKGHYEFGGIYHPSKSKGELEKYVLDGNGSCSDEYIANVKKFVAETMNGTNNEFEENIYDNMGNYYMSLSDIHFIFFGVKNYEKYLLNKDGKNFNVGEWIHLVGKVINDKVEEGIYGSYHVFTIKTSNGSIFIRKGIVPNENGIVDAYTFIDNCWKGDIFLGRMTKKPKKGIIYKDVM